LCPGWSSSNQLEQAAAQQILALISLGHENFVGTSWQTVLLSWGILLFSILCNTVLFRHLPLIEGIMIFIHWLGFIAFIIVLWCVFPPLS